MDRTNQVIKQLKTISNMQNFIFNSLNYNIKINDSLTTLIKLMKDDTKIIQRNVARIAKISEKDIAKNNTISNEFPIGYFEYDEKHFAYVIELGDAEILFSNIAIKNVPLFRISYRLKSKKDCEFVLVDINMKPDEQFNNLNCYIYNNPNTKTWSEQFNFNIDKMNEILEKDEKEEIKNNE